MPRTLITAIKIKRFLLALTLLAAYPLHAEYDNYELIKSTTGGMLCKLKRQPLKIEGINPEFYFRALYRVSAGWNLTNEYFGSQKEVDEYFENGKHFNAPIKEVLWPVEMDANGYCIVPQDVK